MSRNRNTYKTYVSTVENVKTLFSQTEKDTITLEEAFTAWGDRGNISDKRNRVWISNLLTYFKHYELVKPIYSRKNKRRILTKIQLTLIGKKALGRVDESMRITPEPARETQESHPDGTNGKMSLSDAMQMIAKLRKDNPEYQITFDIKLREMME